MVSNVTAYFTSAAQRQYNAAYIKDGGSMQFFSPQNGMATVGSVGNAGLALALPLQQGSTYIFFPAIHADFADATVQWVQCTTLVQIVRMP